MISVVVGTGAGEAKVVVVIGTVVGIITGAIVVGGGEIGCDVAGGGGGADVGTAAEDVPAARATRTFVPGGASDLDTDFDNSGTAVPALEVVVLEVPPVREDTEDEEEFVPTDAPYTRAERYRYNSNISFERMSN